MDHRLNAILKYLVNQQAKLNIYLNEQNKTQISNEIDYIKYLEELNNFHKYQLNPIERIGIEPIINPRNKPYGAREPYQAPKSHIISQNSNNRSSSSKHVDDYRIENKGAKSIPRESLDKVYHDVREAYNINKEEEEINNNKFEITEEDLKEVLKEFQEGYWERYRELELYRIPLEIGLKWYLNEIIIKYYNNKYSSRKNLNYFHYTHNFKLIQTYNEKEISELNLKEIYPIGQIFNGRELLTVLTEKELNQIIIN